MQPSFFTLIPHLAGELHLDLYQTRLLLEAVAMSRNEPSLDVDAYVPLAWLPSLHALAKARAQGLAWPEAFLQAGLEMPEVNTEISQCRRELLRLREVIVALTSEVPQSAPN